MVQLLQHKLGLVQEEILVLDTLRLVLVVQEIQQVLTLIHKVQEFL